MISQVCVIFILCLYVNTGDGAATQVRDPMHWTYSDLEGTPITAPTFLSANWEPYNAQLGNFFILPNRNETIENEEEPILQLPKRFVPREGSQFRHYKAKSQPKPKPVSTELGTFLSDIWVQDHGDKPEFQEWLDETEQRKLKVEETMREEKRNHGAHAQSTHHWSCETEYGWRNLGKNHYPQFVRTANCTSTTCFNGLFQCVPREYTLKVLKKLEPDEVVSHSTAAQLPEPLRATVKFINVTVNICCECALI